MPTKQTEPFTMIPNRYLETLINHAEINRESRVLLYIIRKTCGYRTDKAKISVREFSRNTGVHYPHVHEILKNLEAKGLICIYSSGPGKTKSYSLIGISKVESELLPINGTDLVPPGGTTLKKKYIYKKQLVPPGGYQLQRPKGKRPKGSCY